MGDAWLGCTEKSAQSNPPIPIPIDTTVLETVTMICARITYDGRVGGKKEGGIFFLEKFMFEVIWVDDMYRFNFCKLHDGGQLEGL